MKKIVSIAGIVVGALLVLSQIAPMVIAAILKTQISDSVGIIGGADGPTAVLVVGTLSAGSAVLEILLGIFLIIIGIVGYRKYKE